jgi:uncharacterized membrane protein YhaH (DUF805 family)
MTFSDAIQTCFSKYVNFNGTASRSEFWWWVLFCFLASIVLGFVNHKVSALFSLATLLPSLAVTARRLHDTDRSGWWQLIGLVPVIGWIVLVVFCVQESNSASRYAA